MKKPFAFDPIVDSMVEAAQKAGQVIMENFGKQNQISYKTSHQDFATETDKKSQAIIQDSITASLLKAKISETQIGFIGEEGLDDVKGKYLFAVDPIDGTTNFASGIEYFAVSIACFEHGEPKYGVMYNPIRQIFYIAQKGKGAYKISDQDIQKLEIVAKPIDQAIISTYIHSKAGLAAKTTSFLEANALKFRGVRIMGAGVLDFCQIAENAFQVCMYKLSYLWDFSAAKVLIEEAGGQMLDMQGNEIEFHFDQPDFPYTILAGHPEILKQVAQLQQE